MFSTGGEDDDDEIKRIVVKWANENLLLNHYIFTSEYI